jgi:pimeloyl-ACP methyl ester carboxylesterase
MRVLDTLAELGPARLRASVRRAQLEVAASLRQVAAWPVTRASLPRGAAPGDDVIVALHGLFASAGALGSLRSRLERWTRSHSTSFTYSTWPGVPELAETLGKVVADLPPGVRIHLVGHSTGGVVARWFVLAHGGDPRVVQTISLGSPFRGTQHARWMPAPVARDISPGSPVLKELSRLARSGRSVPHLSVVAGHDRVVTETSVHCAGDVVVLDDLGHNQLLFDERAARVVARRIIASRAWASRPSG